MNRAKQFLRYLGLIDDDYREEEPVMATTSTHTLRPAKYFDNGEQGTIEILVAKHVRSEAQDAIVIRTYHPTSDADTEVWISVHAIDAVVSALVAEKPAQLVLFDQDD